LTDLFLDSSAVVKKYIDEPGSDAVRSMLAQRVGGRFYVAQLALVEVVAALHRRSRRGDLASRTGGRLIAGFRRELPMLARVIEVRPRHIEEAASLASRHLLRGYDAVHLAVALDTNARGVAEGRPPLTLVSADRELNVAAGAEGIEVLDPTH
jgi:predicted nucleic acid-binding protein